MFDLCFHLVARHAVPSSDLLFEDGFVTSDRRWSLPADLIQRRVAYRSKDVNFQIPRLPFAPDEAAEGLVDGVLGELTASCNGQGTCEQLPPVATVDQFEISNESCHQEGSREKNQWVPL